MLKRKKVFYTAAEKSHEVRTVLRQGNNGSLTMNKQELSDSNHCALPEKRMFLIEQDKPGNETIVYISSTYRFGRHTDLPNC